MLDTLLTDKEETWSNRDVILQKEAQNLVDRFYVINNKDLEKMEAKRTLSLNIRIKQLKI